MLDNLDPMRLATLIQLAHGALRGRQVLTPETMIDEDEARIVASLPTAEELYTGHRFWQQD